MTFKITGTDVKGLTIEELKGALIKHQQTHPGVAYEVFAEVKTVPEGTKKIMDVFKSAGVKLLHYWAPVSNISPNEKPGKYGDGHVDLLN
jgi:hypothetical protein